MKTKLGLVGVMLGVAVVAGCGGGGGGSGPSGSTGTGSGSSSFACDYANYAGSGAHWCWAYSATGYDVSQAYSQACVSAKGTSVAACSTTDALGKCTFSASGGGITITNTIFYYKSANLTAMSAEQSCKDNGKNGVTATWTAL